MTWPDGYDPRIVLIVAGYPVIHYGKLESAIGVGGGGWEKDEKFGLSMFKMLKAEFISESLNLAGGHAPASTHSEELPRRSVV